MDSEIKFEKAVEQLEKIVEELEGGELDLDLALKRYEEGVKLSRSCTKRLSDAEKKIETLTQSLGTDSELDSELSKAKKQKKARKAKKTQDLSDDLLV